MRSRRRKVGLFVTLLAAAFVTLAASPVSRWIRAADFLSDLGGATAGEPVSGKLVEEDVTIAGPNGPIRARLYFLAERPKGPGVVVAHGVHHDGIDEKRLLAFSRALAGSGRVVVTPELAELADYRITASGVAVLRAAVAYTRGRTDHVEGDHVGLIGFSFAGGLALVAAEEPRVARELAFVTSVGGHHDLSRVLRFLVKNRIETPSGTRSKKAHEYGLVVLLYGHLEHFVPASDLEPMRAGVKAWLEEDRPRARRLSAARKAPESERLWQLLESGRIQELAPEVEGVLAGKQKELAALSPRGRLATIGVPVYLLHGTHDSVIPPSEVEWAALELAARPHDALVTPLLEHVSVGGAAGLGDKLALVRFLAHML